MTINTVMKGIFVGIVLAVVASFATIPLARGGFWMEIPAYCAGDVQIASKLAEIYNSGVPLKDTEAQIELMGEHPNISPLVIKITKEIAELIYAVEPKTDEDYRAVYEGVVHSCELRVNKQQRNEFQI